MLKLTELAPPETTPDDVVTLPYEARQKSRLLVNTDSGTEIGLFLPRGQVLREGLILTGPDHYRVRVDAAPEPLSVVRADDALQFARACYHLGNRHGFWVLRVNDSVVPRPKRYGNANYFLYIALSGFTYRTASNTGTLLIPNLCI